jgi:phosphoserine phosphatase
MDGDSTLTATEGIDLLADIAGVGKQVADITARAMDGHLDFAQSLRERVSTLQGSPETIIAEATSKVYLSEGAHALCAALKDAGWFLGVVSGGFIPMLRPFVDELGIDHLVANQLEIDNGLLTGRVIEPIVDRPAKAAWLRQWAAEHSIPLDHTVAIGDGANDLDMFAAAGISIAFHAKPSVRDQASATIDEDGLDAALPILTQLM